MKVFSDLESFNQFVDQDVVVTIGNFDGVHLGHKDLLSQVKQKYKKLKLVVMTFRPHPVFILDKNKSTHLLQTYDIKHRCLKESGVDFLLELEFNDDLRSMDAKSFCNEVLLKIRGIKAIALGHDFSVGKDGAESKNIVSEIFKKHHLSYIYCNPFYLSDELVSSSKIRELIQNANIEKANLFLGRKHQVDGTVVHGKKIGRDLGFPTANIELDSEIFLPKFGVYAVEVNVKDKIIYGVLNIGLNPTVATDKITKIECHLLDFSQDIYGQKVSVKFNSHIREEIRFKDLDELKEQIAKDIDYRRSLL